MNTELVDSELEPEKPALRLVEPATTDTPPPKPPLTPEVAEALLQRAWRRIKRTLNRSHRFRKAFGKAKPVVIQYAWHTVGRYTVVIADLELRIGDVVYMDKGLGVAWKNPIDTASPYVGVPIAFKRATVDGIKNCMDAYYMHIHGEPYFY